MKSFKNSILIILATAIFNIPIFSQDAHEITKVEQAKTEMPTKAVQLENRASKTPEAGADMENAVVAILHMTKEIKLAVAEMKNTTREMKNVTTPSEKTDTTTQKEVPTMVSSGDTDSTNVQPKLMVDEKTVITKEKLGAGGALHIIHNSVAGFHPVFLGHVGLKPKLDLTFYTTFWTNPSFGSFEQGNDLWLETGVGLGIKALDGKLFINPSIGITSGKFLSGASQTMLAEGIVPSLFMLYNNKRFEFEFYLSHYKSVRNGGDVTKDFLLNWIVPGVKVHKGFSVGAYYEQFVLTRITEGDPHSVYQWLGGYAKMNIGKGHFLRFAAGKNLHTADGTAPEFYKFSAFIALK